MQHGLPRDWERHEARIAEIEKHFAGHYVLRHFDYRQPLRCQRKVLPRLRHSYAVPVAYTEWGDPAAPLLLCAGGVANCAHRFHFLAAQLNHQFRIICLDWVGRGLSGWLADQSEYSLETYVGQLRQILEHFNARNATVLGSSLGATAAIVLAARHPHRVGRLILNDTGPFIPAQRRMRRAQALARHYVFRTPADMLRKIGNSQRNDGPIDKDALLYVAHHLTRWAENEGGRIYRHDPRALMAYRKDACHNVNVWREWRQLHQPVLVLHGIESDTLLAPTLRGMQQHRQIMVANIPRCGHTPMLSDPAQAAVIRSWLESHTGGHMRRSPRLRV